VELGIPFQTTLSNPHVIKPEQLLVACIKKNKELMNFDYNNRNNKNMLYDFGNMLLRISMVVPNGVLVMFSSYALMQNIKNSLNDMGVWATINSNKYIYEEPKEQSKLASTLLTYGKMAHTQKGAFMFAVFRGKISEGIDLSDELCRAVVVVGVPFPPIRDIKIINKKEYMTAKCQQGKSELRPVNQRQLDGYYWYNLQTMRAVNQAIGRVIRHIKDYGAIYFFDLRY
jgi:regulator of telomere elongation helicase 1